MTQDTLNQGNRRVAVITGASSGIGLEAAKALAAQGWRVIACGRNPQRTAKAEAAIRAASANGQVDMITADLALMVDAQRLADTIATLTDRVDVLINNAGGMATEKVITAEGLEENFAGNHLGPFLLTNRLLPLLRRAAVDNPKGHVRIINTASDASEMIPGLNLDDLQSLDNYSVGLAYCSSKLANVVFALALAKRLESEGIVAYSIHPGIVDSNFFSSFDDEAMARIDADSMVTPEQGADTLLWLATSEEEGRTSGGYFHKRAPRPINPLVQEEAFLQRFWEESEKLVAEGLGQG